MIPCLMNDLMKLKLESLGLAELKATDIKPALARHLSNGITMVSGKCYYNYPNVITEAMAEDGDLDIEHDQWSANKVHVRDSADRSIDFSSNINVDELVQGVSLLMMTYAEIRKNRFEGNFRFTLGVSDPSVNEMWDDEVSSCYASFYRTYANPAEPNTEDDLNEFKINGVLFFEVPENYQKPLTGLKKIDDQWVVF